VIEARGLTFAYRSAPVLREVSLQARPGRVLGLIGPNGSGKTTLLRCLHGGLRPQAGGVALDGRSLDEIRPADVAREVAVVVQEGGGETALTAAEMVLLGRTVHLGGFVAARTEDHDAARAALTRVGALHLARRDLAELSGGERQRVLIARALAQEAGHLLLDEPTNHLDIRYQHEVLSLLRGLGRTTVVVLHDLNLAAAYCDDLVLLDRGQVAGAGTVSEVLDPDLLSRVYGIGVDRLDRDGQVHLLYTPLRPTFEETA
jgi:iron complex transport system ATP-binding protein